jgi:hypothetical protein
MPHDRAESRIGLAVTIVASSVEQPQPTQLLKSSQRSIDVGERAQWNTSAVSTTLPPLVESSSGNGSWLLFGQEFVAIAVVFAVLSRCGALLTVVVLQLHDQESPSQFQLLTP